MPPRYASVRMRGGAPRRMRSFGLGLNARSSSRPRRPAADQVIADVRRDVRSRASGLARALDHFQRDANLRLAGGLRDLFNRLAHAIAAEEIHLRIHAGGIAPQHVVDQADRLRRTGASRPSCTAAGW